jgi:hypothetical protein
VPLVDTVFYQFQKVLLTSNWRLKFPKFLLLVINISISAHYNLKSRQRSTVCSISYYIMHFMFISYLVHLKLTCVTIVLKWCRWVNLSCVKFLLIRENFFQDYHIYHPLYQQPGNYPQDPNTTTNFLLIHSILLFVKLAPAVIVGVYISQDDKWFLIRNL